MARNVGNNYPQFIIISFGFYQALFFYSTQIKLNLIKKDIEEISIIMENKFQNFETRLEESLHPNLFHQYIKPFLFNLSVNAAQDLTHVLITKQINNPNIIKLTDELTKKNKTLEKITEENTNLKINKQKSNNYLYKFQKSNDQFDRQNKYLRFELRSSDKENAPLQQKNRRLKSIIGNLRNKRELYSNNDSVKKLPNTEKPKNKSNLYFSLLLKGFQQIASTSLNLASEIIIRPPSPEQEKYKIEK